MLHFDVDVKVFNNNDVNMLMYINQLNKHISLKITLKKKKMVLLLIFNGISVEEILENGIYVSLS